MTNIHAQVSFRDALSDAIHYWELRRIVYNLAPDHSPFDLPT